jgi:hypothetical protein
MMMRGLLQGFLRLLSYIEPHTICAGGSDVETSVIFLVSHFSSGYMNAHSLSCPAPF